MHLCILLAAGGEECRHNRKVSVDGTSIDAIRSKKVPKDNTTGYKGVYLIRGKYVAKIVFQKKNSTFSVPMIIFMMLLQRV